MSLFIVDAILSSRELRRERVVSQHVLNFFNKR